jgi:hypothetical protein
MIDLETGRLLPSIYSLFREAQQKEATVDRQVLAEEVFSGIAEEDYGFYLKQALTRLVHIDVNQMNRSASVAIRSLHEDIAQEAPSYATKPGRGQVLAVVKTDSISSKRDDLEYRRKARFALPERAADGRAIRLGQSTYDDLLFQSERLTIHGESAIADGKTRKSWAEALRVNGVKTLEELPKAVMDALKI